MLLDIIFFIVKSLMVTGGILTIAMRNPIYSVIFLVFTFINAAILLLLFHVEYFAILLILVYLGAIAVLFLFVVMLLNIKIFEVTEEVMKFVPFSLLTILLYLIFFLFFANHIIAQEMEYKVGVPLWVSIVFQFDNLSALGAIIFSQNFLFVFLSALVLLVSLVSSIFLTLTKGGLVRAEIDIFKLLKDRNNEVLLLVKPSKK